MRRFGGVARWYWVGTLVVLLGLYLLVLAAVADTGNPNLVPTLLLLGALVVPLTFVTFARGWAGSQPVPAGTLGAALLFGGVIGVVVAGVLEYDALRALGALPMAMVGLIEEGAKLAVAAALHTSWDAIGTTLTYIVVAVLSIGLLLIGLRQARRADAASPSLA